jgi:outer membrane protein
MPLNNFVLSKVLKPLSALLFACSVLSVSLAQELPGVIDAGVMNARITPRSLAQLLTLRNLELAYGRSSLAVSVSMANAEAALYEPVLFSNLKRSMTERQRTTEERSSSIFGPQDTVLSEQGNSMEAGIRQRIPLGGEVSFSARQSERSNNILSKSSPKIPLEVNAGLVLSFKQPLLRGAGIAITETDKRISAIESQIAQWQYLQQLHKVLAENLSLFWQVDVASQIVRMREQLLNSTQALVQDAQVRIEAGKLAPRANLEIERIRLMRQADLLRALQTRDELKLRLLSNMDLDATQLSHLELDPQPGPNPALQSAEGALAMWAPYQVAILRKRQGEIRLDFADNQRRSAVDLVVSYTHTALTNSDRGAAWDIARSGLYPDWYVGLNIEVGAQGNRRADSQWLAQLQRVEQSETEIAAIRQVFLNDRQGKMMAQIQLERESDLMQQEVQTREALLEGERQRFTAGIGLLATLLQSEQDLLESQIRLADAKGRLETARVARLLADGNLLASFGIETTLPSSP